MTNNFLKNGKKALMLTSVAALLNSSAFADWQSLNQGFSLNSANKNIDFQVSFGKKNTSQMINVNVPGYELDTKVVDGKTYSVINIPNFVSLTQAGNPDLPAVSTNYLVSDNATPEITIASDDFVDIQLDHPLISSKGHITRDINPDTVDYTFSDVYQEDAFFPSTDLAEVSDTFVMHNVTGVNISFNFFQYNPKTQTLRVHNSVALTISGALQKATEKKAVPSFLNNVLNNGFINYDLMSAPLGVDKVTETGRMLIIVHDQFEDAVQPFVEWKKKTGLEVEVVKMSTVGSSADDVKAYVQANFDKGGLSFVQLVGDAEHIPTLRGTVERAHSDQSYGLVAGNDWYLDVVVARFSVKSAEKLSYQIAKSISYEAYPTTGADAAWYKKGTGIASNEGNPKDHVYMEEIRTGLMDFTYDEVDAIYDPSANSQKVADAVNEGRSVINYLGHGSSSAWVSSRFNIQDVYRLKNGRKLPYIWSVACVNGTFAGARESFAEAWLNSGDKDNFAGASAIAAASTNMQWVPPIHWQAEINLALLQKGDHKTFGALNLTGMSKIAEKYGASSKSFKMFVEQTNNFGDGSLRVRFDTPKAVGLDSLRTDGSKFVTSVKTRDGRSVADLNVSVYNSDLSFVKSATTDAAGAVSIELGENRATDLYMTITGTNIIPIVDQKVTSDDVERFNKIYDIK
ncbi:C25 family cysteine peptidase [bacterium]|nr:C25 family cysteine peptidase [bacterium]